MIYDGESYEKDSIHKKSLKNDLINGCFYDSPESESNMDQTASHIIYYICSKSEDCHTKSS
uniref:Uncharacterized protein n=1 Tax=Romanomermis culicivorax TaxID=13658 RepID=A0A915HF03_ROMCU